MTGTDAFVSCGKTCEHAVASDGMFASRSPVRAETCEQTLRARRLKTPGARRSVCKSSLFRLPRNNPFSQALTGLKRIVPIIPLPFRSRARRSPSTPCLCRQTAWNCGLAASCECGFVCDYLVFYNRLRFGFSTILSRL